MQLIWTLILGEQIEVRAIHQFMRLAWLKVVGKALDEGCDERGIEGGLRLGSNKFVEGESRVLVEELAVVLELKFCLG